jgi:serine/threonine-protein kinase
MLPLPGGAGLQPILGDAHKLSDFTLPAGTFKRFDLEQVVRLLLDVLAGLTALHEVVTDGDAFVHGEVCPQNVYVDEHGTARLVPLLNRHLAPERPEATGYAAPERLLGTTPDARTDTFSVGVMLWEALAGKRLFPDRSPAAVLARQVPPIELSPRTAWAKPLCAIAERAVTFEPNLRFQSAHELSNAIVAAAAQQLSRMPTDAWQEEAPTPVFQPRLHLPDLRASAPPVTAAAQEMPTAPVTRAPSPVSLNAVSLGSDTVSPTVDVESKSAPARPARSGRTGLLVVGALTVALGAAGLHLAPRAWRKLQTTDYSSLRSVSSSAAAARIEMSAPPASVLPPAPSGAHTAAASGSAAEARPAPAPPKKMRGAGQPVPASKPKPTLPRAADYGI